MLLCLISFRYNLLSMLRSKVLANREKGQHAIRTIGRCLPLHQTLRPAAKEWQRGTQAHAPSPGVPPRLGESVLSQNKYNDDTEQGSNKC
eukprot:scaffold61702_cov20-Tisochrysis_lutea.AAC.2